MRRFVVGAALVLVLAGCGGDPKADPPPSTSPTPSASSTPTPPALPDAAKANTKAGAIAFVKYYVELINHAQATGDVSTLQSVEDPGCASCTKVRTSLLDIYTKGGSISGGAWHPRMRVALQNKDGSWLVSGFVEVDRETVRKSAGSPAEPHDGGSANAQMIVIRDDAGWKVLSWSRDS